VAGLRARLVSQTILHIAQVTTGNGVFERKRIPSRFISKVKPADLRDFQIITGAQLRLIPCLSFAINWLAKKRPKVFVAREIFRMRTPVGQQGQNAHSEVRLLFDFSPDAVFFCLSGLDATARDDPERMAITGPSILDQQKAVIAYYGPLVSCLASHLEISLSTIANAADGKAACEAPAWYHKNRPKGKGVAGIMAKRLSELQKVDQAS
jgi:hypothetical protein